MRILTKSKCNLTNYLNKMTKNGHKSVTNNNFCVTNNNLCVTNNNLCVTNNNLGDTNNNLIISVKFNPVRTDIYIFVKKIKRVPIFNRMFFQVFMSLPPPLYIKV